MAARGHGDRIGKVLRSGMRGCRGFTLIEVLVVMSISVILVGLVLGPVVQSFRMTREAQAMIDAQDAARLGMEQISRELGEAMYVFDNSVVPVSIYDDGSTPSYTYVNGQQGPIQLPVRQVNNDIEWFTLPNGKIDFILPKMTMHCDNPQHPADQPRDYPRGNEAWPPCPVCGSTNVSAVPKMPLEQDVTIVRYFLGLRYNNPKYDPKTYSPANLPPGEGLFGWRSPWEGEIEPGAENQVVLYRVEFDPHDDTLFPPGMPIEQRLTDPIFFYRTAPNKNGEPCCERWMEIARVIGIGKYQDLVIGKFDSQTGNCVAVEPSVTFRFQAIDNDAFEGAYSEEKGSEYPNAVPAAYLASYGYWIDNHLTFAGPEINWSVTVFRNDNTLAYSTDVDKRGHLVVLKYEYSGGSWQAPVPTFDITEYLNTGRITSGGSEPVEMAFTVDLNKGKVIFALDPPRVGGARSGPVCLLDPQAINDAYYRAYQVDRAGARRMAVLATFDPTSSVFVPNARIVPGSERVVGPDMNPGPNYGKPIRYERVPLELGNAGPNQYKINYDTGEIFFSPVYGQDLPVVPNPNGQGNQPIEVTYKIQFNRKDDIVKGDYITKSLVTIHMGIRMFDPETGKPHAIDLTNSVKVRNAHR